MKKALLVLFAVLMLFAFVGCDNTKIDSKVEEEGNPTEDFIEAYRTSRKLVSWIPYVSVEEGETRKTLEVDMAAKDSIGKQAVLSWFISLMDMEETQLLDYEAIGKVIVDVVVSDKKQVCIAKIEDVEVNLTYENEEGSKLNSKMTINGKFTDEQGYDGFSGKVESLIVNGIAYNNLVFAFELDNYMPIGFSSATCDGKEVNLDILNAANLLR